MVMLLEDIKMGLGILLENIQREAVLSISLRVEFGLEV
jgi:hypothetical protein